MAELVLAWGGETAQDGVLECPLEETVYVLDLAVHVLLRGGLARAGALAGARVLRDSAVALLDLAVEVVLAGLQLEGRGHKVEHVLEGGGYTPTLRPPRSTNALLRAEGVAPVVGQRDLDEPQRVDELQNVCQEDADPGDRDGREGEFDPEVQGHANGRGHPGDGAQPLAVWKHLLLPHGPHDVEAQQERVQDHEHEAGRVRHPEGAELDVDVAQAVVAQRVDKGQEAIQDGDPRIDVVRIPLLLHLQVEPEVLRRGVHRQRGRRVAGDGAGPGRLELLAHPGGRPPTTPRGRRRVRPAGASRIGLRGLVRPRRAVAVDVGHAEDVAPALLLKLRCELPRRVELLQGRDGDPRLPRQQAHARRVRAAGRVRGEPDREGHEGEGGCVVGVPEAHDPARG
mmetsp:Transcript_116660/g.341483  ORF Transcript_116660/g.341483 Transcript_116660/m.341483 type:complete len:398 (-) Transcript_116660:361-1554(-)